MRTYSLLALLAAVSLSGVASAQLSFDFEGVTIQDLIDSGWTLVDDIDVTTDSSTTPPTVQQFPGTLQIETTIVHSGSGALKMGFRDLAYFPLNGEFGTLDLWAWDAGNRLHEYLNGGAGYGPRFGLTKLDAEGYAFGIGAGICDKSYLNADGGYAIEWGGTSNTLQDSIANDPTTEPWEYAGWPGTQGWYSPAWAGYLASGRPNTYDGSDGGGWNHWRIAYLAPGQVEIELIESWAGNNRTPTPGTPGHSFDGTLPGGVAEIFLSGGRSGVTAALPMTLFGDGIYDDITWTPVASNDRPGDADGDGDVDLDDFVILKQNFLTAAE